MSVCVDFVFVFAFSLILNFVRHGSIWRAYRRAIIGRGISLLFSSYSEWIRGIRGSGARWCSASYITQLSGLKSYQKEEKIETHLMHGLTLDHELFFCFQLLSAQSQMKSQNVLPFRFG